MCDDKPSQITCHFLTRPYGLWASMRHPECSGQRRISNRHERVWRVRVLSKLCGMEIAPIHDRVFTVAVTRPAQISLDELFLVVRESCARKNVQRSSRTLGTESNWTTDQILFEHCVQRASPKCDEETLKNILTICTLLVFPVVVALSCTIYNGRQPHSPRQSAL